MNKIKYLLLHLLLLPGVFTLFAIVVANKLAGGINNEEILSFLKIAEDLGVKDKVVPNDTLVIYYLSIASEYSHWIITGSIIWIVVVLAIIENKRRKKNEK